MSNQIMDPARKAEVVAALRSGEYEQGKRALCTVRDGGVREWCCLGVMTDLAVKAGVLAEHVPQDPRIGRLVRFGSEYEAQTLPLEVREWLGVSHGVMPPNPSVSATVEQMAGTALGEGIWSLAELNDVGVPFSVIADLVEDQL